MYVISAVQSRVARDSYDCSQSYDSSASSLDTCFCTEAASFSDKFSFQSKYAWIVAGVVLLVVAVCVKTNSSRPPRCECPKPNQSELEQAETHSPEIQSFVGPTKYQTAVGGCLGYGCSFNCYKYRPRDGEEFRPDAVKKQEDVQPEPPPPPRPSLTPVTIEPAPEPPVAVELPAAVEPPEPPKETPPPSQRKTGTKKHTRKSAKSSSRRKKKRRKSSS